MSDPRISDERLTAIANPFCDAIQRGEAAKLALDLEDCRRDLAAALAREQRKDEALENGLHLSGGWREAITMLEDFCHEPVRLKNMIAAADQLDDWRTQARAALAESAPTPAPREPGDA